MTDSSAPASTPEHRPWYRRLGPALITACVVIGPGSIMSSSNVGVTYGYSLSWVVIISVVFMLTFMSMGVRLGVFVERSPGTILTEKVGRWFAVLLGLGVFFISAAYQFGNNLGVHFALTTYIDFNYLIVIFNALTICFLLFSKHLYQALERLMMVLVGIMLVAFAVNLIFSGPRFGEWFSGFVPSSLDDFKNLTVLALVGTTFVTTAAFYQAYLVKQKGWSTEEMHVGLVDARVGACVMAALTLMLMATPATLFHPSFKYEQIVTKPGDSGIPEGALVIDDSDPARFEELKQEAEADIDWQTNEKRWPAILPLSEVTALKSSAKLEPRTFSKIPEVGMSLKPLFGTIGPMLFFLGVFSAAYSSFLVNSMIGGFILSDGLGLGSTPEDRWPKVFTIAVLMTGMGVGLYCILFLENESPVGLIVAAQAVTVLAAPLVGGTLFWLTSRKDVMGENVNSPLVKFVGLVGFLMILAMSANLAITKVWPKIQAYLGFGMI
ncbi:MAG TPA: Nramp family divalent metal transporter [Planctomycetaceae bacterium]|nr:Nramp family divalent metal transporter [Planctomycetaceae bacterium]